MHIICTGYFTSEMVRSLQQIASTAIVFVALICCCQALTCYECESGNTQPGANCMLPFKYVNESYGRITNVDCPTPGLCVTEVIHRTGL